MMKAETILKAALASVEKHGVAGMHEFEDALLMEIEALGWAVVPAKPTSEMITGGVSPRTQNDPNSERLRGLVEAIYIDMVKASGVIRPYLRP